MHYLTELRESNSLFIMKVGLSIDGFVLVKFTRLVKVNQLFLKHELPHDNKLGDSNRLTTRPLSRMFSRVVKYAERELVESFSAAKMTTFAISWNKITNNTFLTSITQKKQNFVWNAGCACNQIHIYFWNFKVGHFDRADEIRRCDWLISVGAISRAGRLFIFLTLIYASLSV